jgi:hypothetical protein
MQHDNQIDGMDIFISRVPEVVLSLVMVETA